MILLEKNGFRVRQTQAKDYEGIKNVCLKVYPFSKPWRQDQIESHLRVFPEGQLIVEEIKSGQIIGMAASLIVLWDDYDLADTWSDFTSDGTFANHDPANGHTLYGAEIMVDPDFQGKGLGRMLYEGRRQIVQNHKLLRLRAGARLRGYSTYAKENKPNEYLLRVIKNEIYDPTVSFQLKEGFQVIAVVSDYLKADPESMGYAAVIEWLNPAVAKQENYQNQVRMQNRIFAGLIEPNVDLYKDWK